MSRTGQDAGAKTPAMTNGEFQRRRADKDADCLLAGLRKLAVEYNAQIDPEGAVFDSAVRDLLTDVRHLCDVYGLHFGPLNTEAHEQYLEERPWRDEGEAAHE